MATETVIPAGAKSALEIFSDKQDRLYALASTLLERLANLRDANGELRDPVAVTLASMIEDEASSTDDLRLAAVSLRVAGADGGYTQSTICGVPISVEASKG